LPLGRDLKITAFKNRITFDDLLWCIFRRLDNKIVPVHVVHQVGCTEFHFTLLQVIENILFCQPPKGHIVKPESHIVIEIPGPDIMDQVLSYRGVKGGPCGFYGSGIIGIFLHIFQVVILHQVTPVNGFLQISPTSHRNGIPTPGFGNVVV